jgi:hypothetical protein
MTADLVTGGYGDLPAMVAIMRYEPGWRFRPYAIRDRRPPKD